MLTQASLHLTVSCLHFNSALPHIGTGTLLFSYLDFQMGIGAPALSVSTPPQSYTLTFEILVQRELSAICLLF